MALFAEKTQVSVSRTRQEIEGLLDKHKAKRYGTAVDYENMTARVQFHLHDRVIRFVIGLPDRKKYRRDVNYEQAERQRWRALLLVIKAKLESVENAIEAFEEAFLGQIVMPNDQTVAHIIAPQIAESYSTGKMPRQLTSGEPSQEP